MPYPRAPEAILSVRRTVFQWTENAASCQARSMSFQSANAAPVLLGVFRHHEARECDCLVPHCLEAATAFATFLLSGIVVLPVCDPHGKFVQQQGRIVVESDRVMLRESRP